MIIYKIRNKITRKCYIGMTKGTLEARWRAHIRAAKNGADWVLQRAIRMYGIQSFTLKIIDTATTRKVLCEKERYWIKHFDCIAPKGYNLTAGGDGIAGLSAEVRAKMSRIALKGNYLERITNSGKTHRWKKGQKAWNKGKKCSAEWLKNLSESHKGYKMPLEQRLKIGAAHKGHRNYNPDQPRDLITGRLVSRTIQ